MIQLEDIMLGQHVYRFDEVRKNLSTGIVSRIELGKGALDPSPIFYDRDLVKPRERQIGFYGRDSELLQNQYGAHRSYSSNQYFFYAIDELISHYGEDNLRESLDILLDGDFETLLNDLQSQNSFKDRNPMWQLTKRSAPHLTVEDAAQAAYTGPPLGSEAFTVIMEEMNVKVPIWIAQTWVAEIFLDIKNGAVQTGWNCYKPNDN